MSGYNPKLVGKSSGLSRSVFHPFIVHYNADGTGRDVHCFTAQRDPAVDRVPALNTAIKDNGAGKKPNIEQP